MSAEKGASVAVGALLREYGSAMRGNWADIDGRTVRDDMGHFAHLLTVEQVDLVAERRILGICPDGNGHWDGYCTRECHEGPKAESGAAS